jgi:hypothetical protein
MNSIMKEKPVSITEQKRLLNQLLQCAKYTKNPHDLLKFVPSLKISIQTAEIKSKIKMNSVKQLELFPSRKQLELFPDDVGSIDNYGISLWINRNVGFEQSDSV